MVTVGNFLVFIAFGIKLSELVREGFHFLFDVEQMAKNGEAFFRDAAAGERQTVLGKVASGRVLGRGKRPFVERLHAREHLQQSRFARAVAADQADAFSWTYDPVTVFEKSLGAKMFSGRGELNHAFRICRAVRDEECELNLLNHISPAAHAPNPACARSCEG